MDRKPFKTTWVKWNRLIYHYHKNPTFADKEFKGFGQIFLVAEKQAKLLKDKMYMDLAQYRILEHIDELAHE